MRLWQLALGIVVIALGLGISRDPAGRVALFVFLTALGEVFFGTTALLALFRTIGAIGEARDLVSHAEAFLATAAVLTVATLVMSGWLFGGVWLVQSTTP